MAAHSRPVILLPVTFPEPSLSGSSEIRFESLNGVAITLLGYWDTSADAATDSDRLTRRTRAEGVLYDMAAQFSHSGIPTSVKLQFGEEGTDDWDFTRTYLGDTEADGLLLTTTLGSIRNIFVPLRDTRHADDIIWFLSLLDPDRIFVLELYHAVTSEGEVEPAERMLDSVKQRLLRTGFSEADFTLTVDVVDTPKSHIAEHAKRHNLTMLGATERPRRENDVIGTVGSHVLAETASSVLIIL